MNLGTISPYFFEDRLIISLSKEWMKLFNGIPKFKVLLDSKNQLVLQGPTVKKSSSEKKSLSDNKETEVQHNG